MLLLHVPLPFCLKDSELRSKGSAADNTQQKTFVIAKYLLLQSYLISLEIFRKSKQTNKNFKLHRQS